MDGDQSDIPRLVRLAAAYDALLYVDEAHATGVLGSRGVGLMADHMGEALVMGTFSKAMGGYGAYIACSQIMRDYLLNMCPSFIFNTAPPPAVLGAMDAALDIVPEMYAERNHLRSLRDYLRQGLKELGFDTLQSSTHIVPLIVGPERDAMHLSKHLFESGIAAVAIRPPTVPKDTSRIRFALRATHTVADINHLLKAISSWPLR